MLCLSEAANFQLVGIKLFLKNYFSVLGSPFSFYISRVAAINSVTSFLLFMGKLVVVGIVGK